MADDVEMIPVTGAEPPKAKPTLNLSPMARKPGLPTGAFKPGVKLPPKPGLATGVKLPPKPGLATGVKLPTKPGLATAAPKAGVPVIRKPGSTVTAAPLPKPVMGTASLPRPAANVEKTPLEAPKPMDQLKSVTQKLKGITQEIPQQAILRKTGIIAGDLMTDAQREAAKHTTARISLSDAMGVAPVANETVPMKTIRIKRPANLPPPTSSLTPPAPSAAPASAQTASAQPSVTQRTTLKIDASAAAPAQTAGAAAPAQAAGAVPSPGPTITQRKTLKIARPGGLTVRPTGKFGAKRPAAPGGAKPALKPATPAAPAADAAKPEGEVADIPDIPSAPVAPVPNLPTDTTAPWVYTLSALVQMAACGAIGALAFYLYQNTQLASFCGGLGWGA